MFNRAIMTVLKYTAVFAVTAGVLLALLLLAAMIPREAIQKHSLESAEYYFDEGDVFFEVLEGAKGSGIDHYADALLLNIAWSYDVRYPMRSVMLSAYYFTPDHEENENYLMAVRDGEEPNQQYLRYWHGSIAIVRPLLTVMPVRGIYIFNAIVLILFFAAVMIMLLRMREPVPAFGILLGIILTAWWFVPLCLEYTWMCQLSLLATIMIVILYKKEKEELYGCFFLTVGIVSIYLDFFTTETLTLLIPLLTLLWLERQKGRTVRTAVTAVLSWGIGYVLMWALKWLLAAIVFQENVMPYLRGHIEEWIGGRPFHKFVTRAVFRNIKVMFPVGYGTVGIIAAVLLLLTAVCFGFIHRRKDFDVKLVLCFAVLGLIPFLRYIVLRNHSYRHFFFTYRALAATVMAIMLILAEITGYVRERRIHDEGKT